MAYASWSVVFGEQPSATKWNILGTNDASFNNGTGLPVGTCVQQADALTTAVATGTTTIPTDNTIPQNTEGDQYITCAITPRSATNKLIIESVLHVSGSTAVAVTGALFQDSTANALAGGTVSIQGAGFLSHINIYHSMTAGTTSSTTFKVRAGGNSAATVTVNGAGGARLIGAVTQSALVIREYTV